MVVEVLVAQRQSVDPLRDEMLKRVLDELGVTMIGEALSELSDDRGELLGLAEQQATAVGGDVAAIERAEDREIQAGRVGVVERDFHCGGPEIGLSVTPGTPFPVSLGFTVCHCRVPFQNSVYCFTKYIYV